LSLDPFDQERPVQNLTTNPAFAIYCLTAVALSLNLLGLWGYSGAVRGKTKTTPNPEDPGTVAKGAQVVAVDPPQVARVLRAHTNAMASIVPHLGLGLLYVILGASAQMAWIFFGGFTVLRFVHSFAYVGEKQPWRTISFVIGGLFTLGLMVLVGRAAVALL
jgi:prostaglandin-E synthase 1